MLGKTLKYEFRALSRQLLPFFALSIAISAILRLMLVISPHIWGPAGEFLSSMASMLGGFLMLAVGMVSFFGVLSRFSQSMTGNESYLTHTLPVKTSTHIWSHLISSVAFGALGAVVCYLCSIIFIPGFKGLQWDVISVVTWLGEKVSISLSMLPLGTILLGIGLIVFIFIVSFAGFTLQLYASVAISTRFKHRTTGIVLSFFAFNFVQYVLALPAVISLLAKLVGDNSMAYISDLVTKWIDTSSPVAAINSFLGLAWVIAGVVCVFSIIFSVLHFFITRHYLGKKLNLE